MSEVQYVRKYLYDGQEFATKAEVVQYQAKQTLYRYATMDDMIADADNAIVALKVFATPKVRGPRVKSTNGAVAAKSGKAKSASAPATA